MYVSIVLTYVCMCVCVCVCEKVTFGRTGMHTRLLGHQKSHIHVYSCNLEDHNKAKKSDKSTGMIHGILRVEPTKGPTRVRRQGGEVGDSVG
jgi:hypothetical protein